MGPHGYDPGPGTGPPRDSQSGVPVRALTPLFMRFGVDAVFAGHDEMFERSEIEGMEVPEVLLGGHHAKIDTWRQEHKEKRTKEKRPDLWKKFEKLKESESNHA